MGNNWFNMIILSHRFYIYIYKITGSFWKVCCRPLIDWLIRGMAVCFLEIGCYPEFIFKDRFPTKFKCRYTETLGRRFCYVCHILFIRKKMAKVRLCGLEVSTLSSFMQLLVKLISFVDHHCPVLLWLSLSCTFVIVISCTVEIIIVLYFCDCHTLYCWDNHCPLWRLLLWLSYPVLLRYHCPVLIWLSHPVLDPPV